MSSSAVYWYCYNYPQSVNMGNPLFSVVIPTRERVDTLRFALESCVSQDYADVEIVVCNNASTDGTESFVQRLNDPRIRLVNPGKRVSMRENWEFALEHVTGKFVTYIGDDDALMPGALDKLAQVLDVARVDAVKWQAPTYFWSKSGHSMSGRVSLSIGNRTAYVDSRSALNALRWGYLHYFFLPMIYHGALSQRLISAIRARTGKFFCCENPDIYSGIAAAIATERYLYIQVPLTISGASRHSNGTAFVSSLGIKTGTETAMYFAENTLKPHPDLWKLSDVPSSLHSCVTDALLRARDGLKRGKFYVPLWYRLFLTIWDLSKFKNEDLSSPLRTLREFSRRRRLEWLFRLYQIALLRRTEGDLPSVHIAPASKALSFDLEEFGVTEVNGASICLGKLMSCFPCLPPDTTVKGASILFGRLFGRSSVYYLLRLFELGKLS